MAWYEYPTNYSNGTSVDGVGKMFLKYPSYILDNAFGGGILLLIWLITFGISLAAGTSRSLSVASFITFIFSVFFVRLGLINLIIPIALIILTIVGMIGSKDSKGGL